MSKGAIINGISKKLCLITALLLFAVTTAVAQTGNVRFSKTRLTVNEALAEIRRQTNYGTAFNSRLFDAGREVVFTHEELSLDSAMKQILSGTGFTYSLNWSVISIIKSSEKPEKKAGRANAVNTVAEEASQPGSLSGSDAQPYEETEPAAESIPADIGQPQTAAEPEYEPTSNIVPVELYAASQGKLPVVALKSDLLYAAATLTPNLALEIGLGKRTSLELSGSYNPWNLSGNFESNKKFVHMLLRAEFRYWLCERYNGHFFGADAMFGRYNMGTVNLPPLFKKDYRYDGIAFGGGVTYGYHLMLGKRWGAEFKVGAGVMRFDYDRYDCKLCDRDGVNYKKTYFGLTNVGISIVWLIK